MHQRMSSTTQHLENKCVMGLYVQQQSLAAQHHCRDYAIDDSAEWSIDGTGLDHLFCLSCVAGSRWLQLSEGHFNESLLPVLLASAPGAAVDVTALQATMEVVMRDKNAALDALDKVGDAAR